MKNFNVTLTQVSKSRPDYYNIIIDGKPMAELKYVHGYIYGFYPATNMGELVYNTAAGIVNSLHFDDRGKIGATGDFQLIMSNPLVSK